MSYKVTAITNFKKEAKKLIKKYPSLIKELDEIGDELTINPTIGTPIGSNCYKIRLAIASKGKGKSGGARIITYVYVSGSTVFLLSIYDKSEKSTLSTEEIKKLLAEVSID
jgi:mRNA-degrading endonuclease RelE of RelBE toxin-antitoxin system